MNKENNGKEKEKIESKREKLKEFYFDICKCTKCDLSKTRTHFVFGSGNPESRVIFVGEAPGKNEDLQGKPFVGQAGKLLDELLASIGFARNEVFIANVLKCRPPLNRDPSINEIGICKQYLFEQIKIIDPEVICTMGRYSTQLILDTQTGISNLRGNIYKKDGRIVIPINHPAAALYTRSRMQVLKEDFKKLREILDSISTGGPLNEALGAMILEGGQTGDACINQSNNVKEDLKKAEGQNKIDTEENRQLGLF